MTYNGWSNYETWRTNIELFDGMTVDDMGVTVDMNDLEGTTAELVNALSDYAHEVMETEATGFSLDIAVEFLNSVSFQEIGEHILDDYLADLPQPDEDN